MIAFAPGAATPLKRLSSGAADASPPGFPGRDSSSNRRRLRISACMMLLLALLAGCGRMQQGDPTTQDAYAVSMAVEPAPPSVGPGALVVSLKDLSGNPVDGATLEVEANMSHAGMVPVLANATESRAGIYRVPLRWTMGGDWYVDLKFTLPDGSRVVRRFPVDVK